MWLSDMFSIESELFAWVRTSVIWPLLDSSPLSKPLCFSLCCTDFILAVLSCGATHPVLLDSVLSLRLSVKCHVSRANTECVVQSPNLLLNLWSADCLQRCKLQERKLCLPLFTTLLCCLAHKYF